MRTVQFNLQLFSKGNANTAENEEDLIVTFNDETLKKELNKVALKGLQAFVSSYNKNSITAMEESYQFVSAMEESYSAATSLCEFETQKNMSTVDLVSGITTQVANLKKVENSLSSVLGDANPKAGIITSVIGFSGAYLATLDGITPEEKAELVKSGIDLIGEGAKLLFKVMLPGASLAIDVGIDMTVALAKGIYETVNSLNRTNISGNFAKDYYDELSDVESSMSEVLEKYKLRTGTVSDDYVKNTVSGALINTFAGNDTITNGPDTIADKATKVKINGGVGNDLIITSWGSAKSVINGDLGNDTVKNYSDNVSISGGGGDDLIRNDGDSTLIKGGEGNDSVENYGGNVSVNSGEGDDSVKNYGDNVLVNGDAGNNLLKNYGSNVTINGSNEKNVIINTSPLETYVYEYGFYLDKSYSRFVTGGSRDSVNTYSTVTYVNSYDVIMNGGSDNDFLFNNSSFATINGYEGNDVIANESGLGWVCILFPLDGSWDWKYVNPTRFGDHVIIDSGMGNDSISNNGVFTYVKCGDGDDVITNGIFNKNIDIPLEDSTEDIIFNFSKSGLIGSYDDKIESNNYAFSSHYHGDISVIEGGTGNDTITNLGSYVTVNGGDGDDVIDNRSRGGSFHYEVSKSSGEQSSHYFAGDYYVISEENLNYALPYISNFSTNHNFSNQYLKYDRDRIKLENYFSDSSSGFNENYDVINGGDGNDSISNNGGYTTVNGGDGDDAIVNEGVYVTIDGGDGEDVILNDGYLATIYGGADNDAIYLSSSRNILIRYEKGDGNDTVYGLGTGDTLEITGTKYSTVKSGNDLIISVGTGKIRVVDGANSSFTIWGTLSGGGDTTPADTLPVGISISNSILTASSSFTGNKINLTDYNSTSVNAATVSQAVSIVGNASNNSLRGGISNDTISGGTGNDTLTGGNGTDIFVYSGGNDTITDYAAGQDKIKLDGVKISSASVSGNNVILTTPKGKITLQNVKGKNITVIDSNGKETSQIYPVEQSKSLNGTSNDDNLQNTVSGCTINGISGNDTIKNWGENVQIFTGNGENEIDNWGKFVKINTGSGSDYIYNNLNISNVTINSGDGADEIVNRGSSVVINSGNGADYVFNSGDLVSIDTTNGDDEIINNKGGNFVTISAGYGEDYIYNLGDNVTINASAGNDSISLESGSTNNFIQYVSGNGNDIIYGVKANDTLQISGSKYTTTRSGEDLIVGAGSGKITLVGAVNTDFTIEGTLEGGGNSNPLYITGTSGADYIYNTVASATIFALAGDDSIQNFYGNLVSINADDGNDNIEIYQSSNITINAGAGNDNISNVESDHTNINAGAGNDFIDNIGSYVTIDGGNDNDFILNELGDSVSINGGKGNDSITTYGYYSSDIYWYGIYVTVNGGSGNDLISLSNSSGYAEVQYASGDGNDIIYGINSTDSLKISGAKYSTVKSGSDLKVNVGNGSILLKDAANLAVKIIGTMESGSTTNETLQAGMSIKSSVLTASTAFKGNRINLADYEATKVNASALTQNVTIIGSSAANSIKSGKGADIISGVNGKNTISGGSGNDSILGGSDNDKLLGETGNDTLNGGSGNDTLTGGAGVDVFVYDSGNDLITDYKSGEDKIKIGTITNSTIKGSDVILTTGNDNLTIKGAKDKVVTLVDNSGNSSDKIFYADTSYTPLVTGLSYDAKRTILTAASKFSGNLIDLSNYLGTVTKVNASALTKGISIIGNSSANNSIKGGKGADTISGNSGKDTITGGNGNDLIFGGADNDKLLGEAGNDTLNGGTGNDTLTGGAGQDIFIYSGGNDIITDYKTGEDKIKLNPSAITSSSVKGSDVVLTTNNGTLTVKGAKDKVITFVGDNGSITEKIFYANISYSPLEIGLTYDAKRTVLTASNKYTGSTIYLSEYLGTVTKINATAPSQALNIVGNSSANSIKAGKGSDTINGDGGKDTISGDNGNDSIYGGTDNDLLKGDAGNDTLNGGTGNDTLTGGAGNDIFVYEGGNDSITDYKSGEDKIKLSPSSITNSTVKGSDVILTTNNGTLTVKATKDKVITFVGDNGRETDKIFFANTSYEPLATGLTYDAKRTVLTSSNKFTGSKIDLGEYLGTVTKINAAANSQPLNIIGNSSANSIKGGKGADTISGGKGNDTLTGGGGSDVFVYQGGNDIITDYTAGQDSIKVSGSISNVSYNGKNVIFSIGTGSLTVTNAKGKDIAVTDSSNKTQTYSRTLELLYDNNFMTDEFGIDEISEVTETNYSVGQIEYSNNNNDFIINSVVADSSFDKK